MTENTYYEEDFNEVEAPKKKGGGKTAALIALGALLAGSLGFNGYQMYKNGGLSGSASEDTKSALNFYAKKDSIQQQILALQDSIKKLLPFQDENMRLVTQLEESERKAASAGSGAAVQRPMGPPIPMTDEERAKYQSRERELLAQVANLQKQLNALPTVKPASNGKLSAADKKQLEEANKRISDLESELSKAKEDRDNYSRQIAEEQQKYAAYESENKSLKDKINRGGKPQYGTLQTIGIYYKGGQPEETFSAKKIEKMKITFDILENPLIDKPTEQEVTIRIIGPEGEVLTTNTQKLTDKSSLYSIKQVIVTEGEMGKTKWFYPLSGTIQKGSLKKGKYTTELYAEGVLKQRQSFTLE